MNCRPLALLALVLTVVASAERAPEIDANWKRLDPKVQADIERVAPYLYRRYHAYRTDTAPAIDGRMDDACWQDAEVADDFYIHASIIKDGLKLPANATEVRVAYDVANLYVFYKLYDREMDKLQKGQPQDYRDVLDVHADQIELFLQPIDNQDRTHYVHEDNAYFQMCVNPLGTTYDTRGYGGFTWNPDWQTGTDITNEFWTVELAIPFAELFFVGKPTMTPTVGETWGALFARDQGTLHEWSRWTTAGIPGTHGFHNPENWGLLIFAGRRDQVPVPPVQMDRDATLAFGRNELVFTVKGAVDGGTFTLCRDGAEIARQALPAGSEFRIPFTVTDGGDLHAAAVLVKDGREVYHYDLRRTLPRAARTLATMERETGTVAWTLETMNHPQARELLERCRAIGRQAAQLKADFAAGIVTDETLAAYEDLAARWRDFAFDVERLKTYPARGEARTFTAIPVDAYAKIRPHHLPREGILDTVRLAAAGNDVESFQIAVLPYWTDLDDLNVTATDLGGPNGAVIPAANVAWYRVEYAQQEPNYRKTLPGYDPDDPVSLRDWADIMWPGRGPVKAPADRIQPLWVNVRVPAGTPAGTYAGTVTASAAGQEVVIPVAVEAYGFDIPKDPTLKNNHWYSFIWPSRYYGPAFNQAMQDFDRACEIVDSQLAVMADYRVATYPMSGWNWITAYYEADGSYTFDFSKLERIIRVSEKHGANWFCSSFGCNYGGVISIYNGAQPVIARATGKTMPLRECPNMKPLYDKYKELKPHELIFHSPFYVDFMAQYVPFLKNVGVLDHSYFEMFDENGPLTYVRKHKHLRQIAPELKLMNYGPHPLQRERKARGLGYADLWAPGLNKLDNPEEVRLLRERRNRYGEPYGFYVCGAMERPDGRETPYIKLTQPAVAPRIIPWYAWKHRCDHFLVFMMFTGMPDKSWPEKPAVAANAGYSPMFYPGPDYELLPSVRLAALRDGMEDYEYFHELDHLTACLDDMFVPHAELLKRIEAELAIPEDICATHDVWTRDVEKLRAKRARVAALIREARAAVAAYPESLLAAPDSDK